MYGGCRTLVHPSRDDFTAPTRKQTLQSSRRTTLLQLVLSNYCKLNGCDVLFAEACHPEEEVIRSDQYADGCEVARCGTAGQMTPCY